MSKVSQMLSFYITTAILNVLAVTVMLLVVGTNVIASKIGTPYVPILSSSKSKQQPVKVGVPTEIRIDSLGLVLQVKSGEYNSTTNSWTLNESDAFFAKPSMPVNNQRGNTLIYGHNISSVFKNLTTIELGSELVVKTDSNYSFTYIYSGEKHVDPTDMSAFAYETAPTVTLQTCTGSWDQLRGLYTFSFKEVVKA